MDSRSSWDFTSVYRDAVTRLDQLDQYQHEVRDIDLYSWPQTWSSSSCGFGGLACQAFWTAQTIVAASRINNVVLVYHDSRFAYRVNRPSKTFWLDVSERQLAGAGAAYQVRRQEYCDADQSD